MSDLIVSKQQLNSHLFLADLVLNQGLKYFHLSDKTVTPILEKPSLQPEMQSLVMFAEGLHLGKVCQVARNLTDFLTIEYFTIVKAEGVAGFAISAQVKVMSEINSYPAKSTSELKQHVIDLAQSLSIELCLVDNVPSLRQPGLLLMDMDSTVIAVECIDEIAALAGVGEQVASVTAQAMQGKLDFAQSLRTRVACLKDCDEAVLQQVRQALPLMPGIANLVCVLKKANWKLAIASGGFTYFADYLAQRLELDAAVANQLEVVDGKLTGQVAGGIVDAQVKAQTLLELANKWGIPIEQTMAMGDGANDLVMMRAAAFGVACHAKPVVRQQADISISKGSLDALIWVLAAQQ